MKKKYFGLFVISIITLSLLFLILSYSFIDKAIVWMLANGHTQLIFLERFANWKSNNTVTVVILLYSQLSLLFFLQTYLLFKKNINLLFWLNLGIVISFIMMLAYPIVSRDIYSYLFASKIVVNYHANPYFYTPDIFAKTDLWFGFTHWVDRVYVYPIFSLIYTSILMFLIGSSKFIANFFAIKFIHWLLFLIAGISLYKYTNKKLAIFLWLINPFLLIELLVNSHNDVVMISLFILAYNIYSKSKVVSLSVFVISVLTKTVSIIFLPIFLIPSKVSHWYFKIVIFLLFIYFQITTRTIQPWYYTWIFMALPFAKFSNKSLFYIFLFTFILTIEYIPFLVFRNYQPLLPYSITYNSKIIIIFLFFVSELAPLVLRAKKQYINI